jgi:cell division protein FtsB
MSQPVSNQLAQRSRVPRIAEAAVERARLTVVPRGVTRAPRVPFVALVSLLLVSGVAGLLLFNTSMQQASFHATALEQQAQILAAEEQSLQMELEMLRDPQRVAAEARAIGMVPPANPAFIRLSDGRVLGTPTPAVPEDGIRIAPLPTLKPKNLRPDPVIVPAPETAPEEKADDVRSARGRDGAASAAQGDPEGTKNQRGREGRPAGQQGSER